MEKQLFDWEEWDVSDEGVYVFVTCTLKIPIGQFEAGDQFDWIMVNYQLGKITLCFDKVKEVCYKLEFQPINKPWSEADAESIY
jgi:hypothetical protein